MGQFIGDYEVIRKLGAGHFGTVYLAVGEVPGRGMVPGKRRPVAIKKLTKADPGSVSLLLQEFALLEQVKHRSIVRVFEYLEDEHAVVMEYIHGVNLRRMIEELDKAREQVFTEAAIEIGCELADAVYQAYTTPGDNGEPLRLVHRDLKPANVMLTPHGEVKILDFGLARVDNADFAKDDTDRIKGTPIYMAPEQARGQEVDHRTDLFAIGLILYELLMGEPAYRVVAGSADGLQEAMAAIEAGDLAVQCRELESRLPALGPIVAKLLQPRPDDRYRQGQDLLVDLRRQLYRDRGAYLQEFCEFFFGTICDIGDPPTLEGVGGASRASSRRRRKSIEERLKESMAREARAKEAVREHQAAPSSTPAQPKQMGATMASKPSAAGGGRRLPPVGGGASRAVPFEPGSSSRTGKKVKQIGQRRPDETGMLQMVPLTEDQDAAEAGDDPNATQFFAIPAPKAERARPGGASPPSPPPPPSPALPGGMGTPPPPPPVARPPTMAPPPPGAPPPPVVQGPIATPGGAAGGGASPFQVSGPVPTPPSSESGSRVQSNRVYALVFAAFLMICLAVFVAIWFQRPSGGSAADEANAVAENTTNKDITGSSKAKTEPQQAAAAADTGSVAPPPKPVRHTHRRSSSSSSSAAKAGPVATAPQAGTVTIRMADATQSTAVEIVCPSGVRKRVGFSGGVASFSNIPPENCRIYFKGGPPASFGGVTGGKSYTCNIVGTTAVCK